jgi:hypothetical protein
MVHPGAGGFLRDTGAKTGFGFQPVVAIMSAHGSPFDIEMMGVVANFILGRLRDGRAMTVCFGRLAGGSRRCGLLW